jgi:hypothetical protein
VLVIVTEARPIEAMFIAGPPLFELNFEPEDPAALPPIPMMKPLLTTVRVSPVVPPVMVNPGVAVEEDHRYIPLLIVTVMSDEPGLYPLNEERLSVAFCVLDEKTDVKTALPAVVKPNPLAAAAPKVPSVGIISSYLN